MIVEHACVRDHVKITSPLSSDGTDGTGTCTGEGWLPSQGCWRVQRKGGSQCIKPDWAGLSHSTVVWLRRRHLMTDMGFQLFPKFIKKNFFFELTVNSVDCIPSRGCLININRS